jgi:hypothetical protein
MRRKSVSTVAALAAALATLATWSLAVGSPPGGVVDNGPVEDSRVAQLHIRLLGVSQ